MTPAGEESAAPPGSDGDAWYRGVIVCVYYGSESGALRSDATGREYPFRWPAVEIRGPIPRIGGLREGMVVGFDVSRTAGGPVVSVIKVLE